MLRNRAVRIDGNETIFKGNSLFQIKSGNVIQNVGHYEHVGFIGGKPGTMKSTILRYIAASGADGCMPFGFKLNLEGRKIVWFDGEQPKDVVVNSVNHIAELSCTTDVHDYLEMYELNGISSTADKEKELARIIIQDLIVRRMQNMDNQAAVVIIDGLSNFCDIHNFDRIERFMGKLMEASKRMNAMFIVLSHLTANGDGTKLFGAGGTRLEQLASWGFYMRSEGRYFVMTQAKGRYGFVAPKAFTWAKEKNQLLMEPYFPF